MDDKKYYANNERRRYALDIREITWAEWLMIRAHTGKEFEVSTGFPFLFFSEISCDYEQTSDYESEGMILVSYEEFSRINKFGS